MELIRCLGDKQGVLLTNGHVRVVATVDVGPRIVEYALTSGDHGDVNVLGSALDVEITTELGAWHPYAGHRLWIAPEATPRSYAPDNDPVIVEELADASVRLSAPTESATGVQKSMTIVVDDDGSGVTVIHRLTNHGAWEIELAPWALTIMAANGVAIIPHEPYRSHAEDLLPVRTLALWGYTDLSDPRLTLCKRFIRIASDTSMTEPFKIGCSNAQRWAGWYRDGLLFTKRFPYAHDALYPDRGCNVEVYTAGDFLELESLAPMIRLEPDASVDHVEYWTLREISQIADYRSEDFT
jgi:hypothetical protein